MGSTSGSYSLLQNVAKHFATKNKHVIGKLRQSLPVVVGFFCLLSSQVNKNQICRGLKG